MLVETEWKGQCDVLRDFVFAKASMSILARGFRQGVPDENLMENLDETHFCVNMDNGRTLSFRGDEQISYADVVSGSICIRMVVKVTRGPAARICRPFMIFKKHDSTYAIRAVTDTVPGVCYMTTTSSFMTTKCLAEYYRERRVSVAAPGERRLVQWIDNYPGHNITPEISAALERINTEIRYLPSNSTHLTRPADSFIISKIKDTWIRRWELKKAEMIAQGLWQGDGRSGSSGMLKNPQNPYFLALAAESIAEVNAAPYRDGISYARKAMIRT
ncbi:hypothetical protein R1sor_006107 [Riccia sorocarpa]|uniref:DDE-1 domain-containing protein n=1 Tax=Riccia sorocarpa TaxID=122646 RepID=A0ABD3HQP9_9MARC